MKLNVPKIIPDLIYFSVSKSLNPNSLNEHKDYFTFIRDIIVGFGFIIKIVSLDASCTIF
jgi:hypothetical protein